MTMDNEEVELVVTNDPEEQEEKTDREIVLDQMQKYAKEDIKYGDLIIVMDPVQHKHFQGTAYGPDGSEFFCDAQIHVTHRRLPEPVVAPKWIIQDMLRGLIQ